MSTEHRALCPDCGRMAIREVINHLQTNSRVIEATFCCDQEHLWLIRWLPTRTDQKEAS